MAAYNRSKDEAAHGKARKNTELGETGTDGSRSETKANGCAALKYTEITEFEGLAGISEPTSKVMLRGCLTPPPFPCFSVCSVGIPLPFQGHLRSGEIPRAIFSHGHAHPILGAELPRSVLFQTSADASARRPYHASSGNPHKTGWTSDCGLETVPFSHDPSSSLTPFARVLPSLYDSPDAR